MKTTWLFKAYTGFHDKHQSIYGSVLTNQDIIRNISLYKFAAHLSDGPAGEFKTNPQKSQEGSLEKVLLFFF